MNQPVRKLHFLRSAACPQAAALTNENHHGIISRPVLSAITRCGLSQPAVRQKVRELGGDAPP